MKFEDIKKVTLIANISLLIFVVAMFGFFYYYNLTLLVYFSIPTISVYIIGFFIIHKNLLHLYVSLIYFWIVLYMSVTTVVMGYNYGFHLYSMSLIPIIFYTDYLGYKIQEKKPHSIAISIFIVFFYMLCTGYAVGHEPLYTVNNIVATLFLSCNSLSVFCFLIIYTNMLKNMVITSEEQLKTMALTDRLTGLYNRHYMLEYLNNLHEQDCNGYWIAIIDIDNFKHFNDTYGHNCGDYVLTHLCELAKNVCIDCTVARWGGEEFLITNNIKNADMNILEALRKTVADKPFVFDDNSHNVTITIGVNKCASNESIDNWIHEADKKLYIGKNNGKNQVVF